MDAKKYSAQLSISSEFSISDGRPPSYSSTPSCAGRSPPPSYLDCLSTKSGDGLLGSHDDGLGSPWKLDQFGKHGSASGPEYVTCRTDAAGARRVGGCRDCVNSPLFWSIVVTVFCCSPVLGSAAIYLAVKSRHSSESTTVAKRFRRASIGLAVAAVVINLLMIGLLLGLLLSRLDHGTSNYTIDGVTYHFRFKPTYEPSSSRSNCSTVCLHGLLYESYCYYDTRYTPGFCGVVPAADVYDGKPYRYYIESETACRQAGKFYASGRCYPYVISWDDAWRAGGANDTQFRCHHSFGDLVDSDCYYFNRYDATNTGCSDNGPSFYSESAVLFHQCCYYNDGIQY